MSQDPITSPLRSDSDLAAGTPMPTRSAAVDGPGSVIRQARERARLGIEDLATQTRLSRATLDALERDDFSHLNEAVYIRGYYRKCAKVLNLPEAELIAAYDRLYAPKGAPMPTKLMLGTSGSEMGGTRKAASSTGGGAGWFIGIIVIALLAGGAWFMTQDAPDIGLAPTAPAETDGPIPASELLATPAAPVAAVTGPDADPAAAVASGTPPSPVAALPKLALSEATSLGSLAAGGGDAAVATAEPVAGPGALDLEFRAASWVRIEDADGRTLLSGTIPAGERQTLRGRPPYALFLGYAPGVVVRYEGAAVDLAPHTRANATARVNLPPAPAPAAAAGAAPALSP